MIDRNKLSSKMLESYEEFEPRYAKGIASSIALYMLGVVPVIITSALATQKIVELTIERRKFRTK